MRSMHSWLNAQTQFVGSSAQLPEFTDRPAHKGYPGVVVPSFRVWLREAERNLEMMVGSDTVWGRQDGFRSGAC